MYSMTTRHESPPIPNLPDYVFGERLGGGTYGTVYKARLLSSIQSRPNSAVPNRPASARPTTAVPAFCAIKCINRKSLTKTAEDLLINEIKVLKQIKHEYIVELYDFQWDENYIYIIMEFCAGGDMSIFIRSRQQLSETRARPFVQQIAKVLKFLYQKGISHMDLKPENILLVSTDKTHLKVADFGMAQRIGQQGSRSVRGTLMYMAPEILSEDPYDNRVDLWSIGVILYECLFGRPPFTFVTIDDLIDKIKSDDPIEIPQSARISTECRSLLEGLLQRDPNKRITFPDFFRHPFLFKDLSTQVTRADELLQQSVSYEQSGDLKKALDHRLRALDEYVNIIKIDEDMHRQHMLRMKVRQGVTVAEDLKKRIKEARMSNNLTSSSLTATPTTSLLPSPTLALHDDLDFNSDKELSDAYQHCLNGNQLANAFHLSQACEEYEIGLSVMLPIAKKETNPMKIKILRDVISHYLSKAETCKQRSETQRLDAAIEKIKEDATIAEGTVMDETIDDDKKQQQTCRQQ